MSQTPNKNTHGGKRPGAGRRPKYREAVKIGAQVPIKLRDKLDRFAKANNLSRSEAIAELIRRL